MILREEEKIMGGFKNEAVASQVEVGDRVPSPVPASRHVATGYPRRKELRELRVSLRRELAQQWELAGVGFVFGLLTGISMMFLIAWAGAL